MPLNGTVRKTPGDTAWFTHDRFGMFIHWGLYALPARHEWVKNIERTPEDVYQRYFEHFDPDLYDPREWARHAKAAGMKYVVLTSKHHEGFCLFDSKHTDYKAANTPCGKDLLKPFVEAFRAEGLRVGFYYSLIDWHHPDFTVDKLHPRRDDPDAAALNEGRDMRRYAQYMRDQVRELLTNYGQIDILWFDFSYPGADGSGKYAHLAPGKGKDDWESEKLIALARSLQPGLIIDNRADIEQDLWTPEQYQPRGWVRDANGQRVVWEACQTFSGSWGYHRDEATWKSPDMLVRMLVNTVSAGGNLLLNVGPTARGVFDKRAVAALEAIGGWMRCNGRAIYGCTQSAFTPPEDCRYTQNGDRLYLHLFAYPFGAVYLPGLAGKIAYAQFLYDASEIAFSDKGGDGHMSAKMDEGEVVLKLPVVKPDTLVPVVEIFLKG